MTSGRPAAWPAMPLAEADARLTAPGSLFEVEEVEIRGLPTKVWKNLPKTIPDVLDHARAFGAREFLVFEDERIGYDAFLRAVAAFARELQAQGVGKGDRVAVAMRNLPEWPVAFYGAAAAGAIPTALNAWWMGDELAFALADCGAKVAVLDAERFERLESGLGTLPALEHVYLCRSPARSRATPLEQVLGSTRAWSGLPEGIWPEVASAPDDPAVLFYTSGTTGTPKGVLSSHRAFNSNLFVLMAAARRALLRRGQSPSPPDPASPQKVTLLSIPLFHAAGCHTTFNSALYAGTKVVMMYKWDTVQAYELIARERVNNAGGVTAIAFALVDHPARADFDLSSLEMMGYGGAPCPPELMRRIKQTWSQVHCRQGWGMTETNSTVTSITDEDFEARPESCGAPLPIAELQIRDPEDGATVLPCGVAGEIWVRGGMNAAGYWNRPDATAETFVEGWVRTGDLGRLDDEGFCYIVDRAKDMVIRGGENISCIEVENALYSHPAVAEAAVVGVPHRALGEEPAAVVTLRAGAVVTEAELRAHVAARLASFKVPAQVRFWPEPLPRNAGGKILKAQLRKALAEEPAPA